MNKTIYGVDLTTNNPTLMEIQSCMTSRYDAGICKHMKERTGVIEIIKVDSMYENNTIAKSRAEQSRAEQLNCRVIQLGSAANQINSTRNNPQRQRVYDSNGLSPTINCVQGGGLQPHIVEIEKMGNSEVIGKMLETSNQRYQVYDKDLLCPTLQAAMGTGGGNCPYFVDEKQIEINELGSLYNQHSRWGLYDRNGLSPTMTAAMGMGGGYVPMTIDEKQIVAMRGRNPENPSDRTAGIHLEQRLEPNSENMCNTLTSVQKDNLVLEKDIINPLSDSKDVSWQFAQNVYDEKSTLIRSIKSGEGSGNIPKSITIRQATKNGFVNCEIGGVCDLNYPTSQTRRGRVQENGQVSPTLTTENIPSVIELADPEFYNFLYEIDGDIYLIRIRKLIPLETWRLMGFSDEDFHKAEKVNSNTQLYKQAGNSIVKDVLMAIFKQLI